MIDFRKLFPPKVDLRDQEIRRMALAFSALEQEAMGAELLSIAREFQNSGKFRDPTYPTYDEAMIYFVLPELARRLNPNLQLNDGEIEAITGRPNYSQLPIDDFIAEVATYSKQCYLSEICHEPKSDRDELLFHWSLLQHAPWRIAANVLKAKAFEVNLEAKDHTPLPGVWLIAERDGHESVVGYFDHIEDARRDFDTFSRLCNAPGAAQSDEDMIFVRRHLEHRGSKHVARVSLQDHAARTLQETVFAQNEPVPEL